MLYDLSICSTIEPSERGAPQAISGISFARTVFRDRRGSVAGSKVAVSRTLYDNKSSRHVVGARV